ncbi:MAG: hypothetical protein HQL97_08215 [Magnetococcales bacterium]|nr:hypothetical protein [Magnetococcales bacterium]
MKLFYSLCLALLMVAAPLTVAWSDEPGPATPKANKSEAAKGKESARAAQVKKDKEHVRQVVLAKKQQRMAKKGASTVAKRPTDKTMDLKAKAATKPDAKTTAKKGAKKPTQTARNPGAPGPLGIRTWTYPESNEARIKKLNELAGHIRTAENAYDAENAKYQKFLKTSKEQAKPVAKATTAPAPDVQLAASQQRLTEIMQKLDALHHHRNEVADIVFLKTVKN